VNPEQPQSEEVMSLGYREKTGAHRRIIAPGHLALKVAGPEGFDSTRSNHENNVSFISVFLRGLFL
jgi:hypothetical protein